MKVTRAFIHGIKFLVAFRIACLFGTFHSKVNKHRFNTKILLLAEHFGWENLI